MTRATKTDSEACVRCQLAFFQRHPQLCPKNAVVLDHLTQVPGRVTYQYDYVEGTHVTDWPKLWALMDQHVWTTRDIRSEPLHTELRTYWRHLSELCGESDDLQEYFALSLKSYQLTPVEDVHGDLNFRNAIIDDDGVITLIDMDNRRQLLWREDEEAKMLQSMSGFDQFYYHEDPLWYTPFPVREMHMSLLSAHFLRMLRYIDNPFARAWLELVPRTCPKSWHGFMTLSREVSDVAVRRHRESGGDQTATGQSRRIHDES